ncbi:MAG: hypothetical protein BWY44_00372 [Candidatus Omnitrophica bacterium ADurb.Bin292]|nr:MAG: hypothetical protein BWY44_00372 [Candidatus Omnitrophica bacterium ADurb.Bin292]
MSAPSRKSPFLFLTGFRNRFKQPEHQNKTTQKNEHQRNIHVNIMRISRVKKIDGKEQCRKQGFPFTSPPPAQTIQEEDGKRAENHPENHPGNEVKRRGVSIEQILKIPERRKNPRHRPRAIIETVTDKQQVTHQGRNIKKMRMKIACAVGQRVIDHNRLVRVIKVWKSEPNAPESEPKGES